MPTGQLLHLDRRLPDPPPSRPDGLAVSRPPSAPGGRTLCLYIDERDAHWLAELIAPVRQIGGPGSGAVMLAPAAAPAAPTAAVAPAIAARFLTTVLITDVVGSTATVARLGDRRWAGLLAGHYADCRAAAAYAGGEIVDTTGDGVVALFDGPTNAVRAAIAIQEAAAERGLSVRAGVHCGECERIPQGVAGVAVHVAARVCGLGQGDEVLTTATVRELATGSTLAFEPHGVRTLRGVPGEWPLFRVTEIGL